MKRLEVQRDGASLLSEKDSRSWGWMVHCGRHATTTAGGVRWQISCSITMESAEPAHATLRLEGTPSKQALSVRSMTAITRRLRKLGYVGGSLFPELGTCDLRFDKLLRGVRALKREHARLSKLPLSELVR